MMCNNKCNCNCNQCKEKDMETSIQKVRDTGNPNIIKRTFTVLDNAGNPLPDVEFLKILGDLTKRFGLTDKNGKISITGNSDTTVLVSHVSGETVQSKLGELDDVITFEPNQLDEVIITNEKTDFAGLAVVGLMLAAGVSKAFTSKPLQIPI